MSVAWVRKAGRSYLKHAVAVPVLAGARAACGFAAPEWTADVPDYLRECAQCHTVLKRREARDAA